MAYNRKIKVGSDTISSLKSMGMKEAVRYANSLIGTKGNAEIVEGARRLYGSRVKADTGSNATFKSADSARAAVSRGVNASSRGGTAKQSLNAMKTPPKAASSADAARAAAVKRGVAASSRGGTAKQSLDAMTGKKSSTPKSTSSTTSKSSAYVAGSRDPRVNAANAREAIAKGSGKKITLGKGGYITNKTGASIDVRANAARARQEANKPKTPAQIAAAKTRKAATEAAARKRSANRGYTNR